MQLPANIMQDWLSARVQASPDKTAIITFGLQDNQAITYQGLADRVDSLSRSLIRIGISKDTKVALLLPNIPYLTLIPALMRIGAIVIPINTRLTTDELLWQLDNVGCEIVISTLEYKDSAYQIAQSGKVTYLMSGYRPDLNLLSLSSIEDFDIQPAPSSKVNLNDPFAIIHTSGTSGKPKGAVLTYGNIFYSAMASAYQTGVLPDDRWLCVLPMFHVGGLSILVRSLLYGTTIDLFPYFDVRLLNEKPTHEPITLVSLVPTMLQRLLDARTEAWNPKLRLVLLGGAAPSAELVQRCVDLGIPLATTYGLTEAASQVVTATPEHVIKKPASVGKPLMFNSVRILNDYGKDCATDELGEIIVQGLSIMQGYYKNDEANAKVFKDGWFHTGDMGYKDADGDLFVVQRRSDLIVTGGENVYPAEVEAVLRQHPQIIEAVVVGVDSPEWGQAVAAAIQAHSDLSPDEIMQFARDHLAGYKIPRQIIFVEDFPQTGSGKIQRSEVRKLFPS